MNVFFQYIGQNAGELGYAVLEHLLLTATALAVAVPLGMVLGVFLSREKATRIQGPIFYLLGLGQTIPSLALLALAVGVVGTGFFPAELALIAYGILPVARNTFTGLRSVPHETIDAARGLGMTSAQILREVELPLAAPFTLTGIRTTTVVTISAATLASLIGAGGLGEFIFAGINLFRPEMMLAGALPTALMALAADRLLRGRVRGGFGE